VLDDRHRDPAGRSYDNDADASFLAGSSSALTRWYERYETIETLLRSGADHGLSPIPSPKREGVDV
jgi:hypothetical protein